MSRSELRTKAAKIEILKVAQSATRSAYRRAVKTDTLVVARSGELRQIEPDGTSTSLRKFEGRVRVPKGTIFEIKSCVK